MRRHKHKPARRHKQPSKSSASKPIRKSHRNLSQKPRSIPSASPSPNPLLNLDATNVAAVVTAKNEADTLPFVLKQLNRLSLIPGSIIVVVNGSSDGTFQAAREAGAVAVADPEPLGYDVGRALGAKLTKADIVLFCDADIPIKAEQYAPFIRAIQSGYDIALNNVKPLLGPIKDWDMVTIMKEFINRCAGRADLAANSLTAIPHAMSRKAIEKIGYENLSVPPKAQLIALTSGLKVGAPTSVDVLSANKLRSINTGVHNPVGELIVGDHLEALEWLRQRSGWRMGFTDRIRKREIVEEIGHATSKHHHSTPH